jgi:hypothetical protein
VGSVKEIEEAKQLWRLEQLPKAQLGLGRADFSIALAYEAVQVLMLWTCWQRCWWVWEWEPWAWASESEATLLVAEEAQQRLVVDIEWMVLMKPQEQALGYWHWLETLDSWGQQGLVVGDLLEGAVGVRSYSRIAYGPTETS